MLITPTYTGLHLQGDVGYAVYKRPGEIKDGRMEFDLILFGTSFRSADIRLLYRTSYAGLWKTDMAISSHVSSDGVICGLSCSKNGDTHAIRWEYAKNLVADGSTIEMRIEVAPSVLRFGETIAGYAMVESSAGKHSKRSEAAISIDSGSNNRVLGRDREGNYMLFSGGRFVILSGEEVLMQSANTYEKVTMAKHTESQSYIFIDASGSGTPSIFEIDEDGTEIAAFQVATASGDLEWFDYDPINRTVIYPFNDTDVVREATWDTNEWGTLLWASSPLAAPSIGGAYDISDRNIIWVTLNDGSIVKISRHNRATPVVETIVLNRFSQDWALFSPFDGKTFINVTHDNVLISGTTGKRLLKATSASDHTALARESANDTVSTTNDFPEYRNAIYTPVRSGYWEES